MEDQTNQEVSSKLSRFRGSLLPRRIGSSFFAAMILLHLALITYSLSDRLESTKAIVALVFLWLIGIVALTLILRALRRPAASGYQ